MFVDTIYFEGSGNEYANETNNADIQLSLNVYVSLKIHMMLLFDSLMSVINDFNMKDKIDIAVLSFETMVFHQNINNCYLKKQCTMIDTLKFWIGKIHDHICLDPFTLPLTPILHKAVEQKRYSMNTFCSLFYSNKVCGVCRSKMYVLLPLISAFILNLFHLFTMNIMLSYAKHFTKTILI